MVKQDMSPRGTELASPYVGCAFPFRDRPPGRGARLGERRQGALDHLCLRATSRVGSPSLRAGGNRTAERLASAKRRPQEACLLGRGLRPPAPPDPWLPRSFRMRSPPAQAGTADPSGSPGPLSGGDHRSWLPTEITTRFGTSTASESLSVSGSVALSLWEQDAMATRTPVRTARAPARDGPSIAPEQLGNHRLTILRSSGRGQRRAHWRLGFPGIGSHSVAESNTGS